MLHVQQHDGGLRVETPAKINVGLCLRGKRPDGFHDLESLVLAISLSDTLDAVPADGDVTLSVIPDGAEAPADDSNLALRAARLLRKESGVTAGAQLTLTKRIPAGRGLGGGSSDAAATLIILSHLWDLRWPPERLAALAAQLGSDVPFFLGSPLAVMKGRGEIIEPVDAEVDVAVLLLVPPVVLPTRDVYAASKVPLTRRQDGVSLKWLLHLRYGHFDELGTCLFNDLEPAARGLCKELERMRLSLEHAGATCVSMTGSGSAMFALLARRENALRMAGGLRLGPGVTAHVLGPWHRSVSLGMG